MAHSCQDDNSSPSSSNSDDDFNFYSGAAKRFKKQKEVVCKTGKVKLVNKPTDKFSHSPAGSKSPKHPTHDIDSSDEEIFKEIDSINDTKGDDLDDSVVVSYNQVERFEDVEQYINVSQDISVSPTEVRRTHSAASVQEDEVEPEEEDPLYCAPLNDTELNQSPNDDEVDVVKVRFIGRKVWRIELKRADYFKKITKELSIKTGVDAEKISLYFKDTLVDLYGTLKTVPIKIADIIDAVVCNDGVVTTSENMLEFKVQSRNRNSHVVVSIRPEDPMKVLMEKYADATNNDLTKLTFKFDGDSLKEEDTPLTLDLEGGECIDVYVKE